MRALIAVGSSSSLCALGIDRSVICFVVDQQQRNIPHHPAALHRIIRACDVEHPLEQIAQHADVLLHHEHDRIAADHDANLLRHRAAEIAIVCAACQRVDMQSLTIRQRNLADADPTAICVQAAVLLRVETENAFIQSQLRLAPQILVHPGEHDDELVSGIDCFADQSGVVRRLAGLHAADDHSASIPRRGSRGVFEAFQN